MKIKAILNKIFDLVLNFLISFMIICLIIAMYSFINLKILNNKYTNFFGYTYFEILSGSMEKEIRLQKMLNRMTLFHLHLKKMLLLIEL